MLQTLKVFALRKFYRFIGRMASKKVNTAINYRALQVEGAEGKLAARLYSGIDAAKRPLVVYFHGGGWVIGDLDSHEAYCQLLAVESGCNVLAIDYRLAPEFPFPAANDDCIAAARWALNNPQKIGPSDGRIVLAGDSAGGNLATSTALMLATEMGASLAGELLIYPATGHYSHHQNSYSEKARGYTLSTAMMCWFWDCWIGADTAPPLRSTPLFSDGLAALPPTLLITAENDPLRDEGAAYGEKLRAANVELEQLHFPNAQHGFACSEVNSSDFDRALSVAARWLQQR